ncbi:MAG: FAD-dependent 5-carboxymethylaminomethyl-2-thiouridine(34) oxidoreductase MnmC [Pseudomonadota bacterium]
MQSYVDRALQPLYLLAMSRLPPRPQLSWKDDGTPVDDRVGDIYYSVEDGLSETRAIFLDACGLPDRWMGRDSFTVAELGFGTGLNFLALWDLWRQRRSPSGWLHFVSFEGYPLDVGDAERALGIWPELSDLKEKLVEAWPHHAKGIHRVVWPDERLSLTLHIGLIEDTLPQSQFMADAWFLDGFSPAKNQSMWDESLWPMVAERSAPGTIAATFTVAGAVRRGLAEAGFEVAKRPGHGRKRERLEAIYEGDLKRPDAHKSNPKIGIIGAGIAGACLARVLSARGATVTVFDQASRLGAGASGNPMALVMPRLDADDTDQARFFVETYNAARSFYSGLPGIDETEVVQRAKDDQERKRFAKVLEDPPLGLDDLEAISDGLLHKRAVIVRPLEVLNALLEDIDVQWNAASLPNLSDSDFDAVIYADGWRMQDRFPWLRLKARAGQVSFVSEQHSVPASARASGHYALASGADRLWGATYRDHDGGDPKRLKSDDDLNSAALSDLSPFWIGALDSGSVSSRASARATTPDRLPVIGRVPNIDSVLRTHEGLRSGRQPTEPIARQAGYYIAGGFGSRGFTFAPWAAQVLCSMIFDDPLPAQKRGLKLVDPVRQILRDLKRGQIG